MKILRVSSPPTPEVSTQDVGLGHSNPCTSWMLVPVMKYNRWVADNLKGKYKNTRSENIGTRVLTKIIIIWIKTHGHSPPNLAHNKVKF